jgi:micrococcal nuclease
MKKILFLLILFSCNNSIVQEPSENTGTIIRGKVISVKDGDSIEILANEKIYTIRLAHVDCPEKKQDFGTKAKIFVSEFCFGKEVEAIEESKDRYGRIIAVVKVEGKELNLEIIEAGFGWHFKKYSKSQIHADAEIRAKKKKVGIWSHSNAVAPWDYRKHKN